MDFIFKAFLFYLCVLVKGQNKLSANVTNASSRSPKDSDSPTRALSESGVALRSVTWHGPLNIHFEF